MDINGSSNSKIRHARRLGLATCEYASCEEFYNHLRSIRSKLQYVRRIINAYAHAKLNG